MKYLYVFSSFCSIRFQLIVVELVWHYTPTPTSLFCMVCSVVFFCLLFYNRHNMGIPAIHSVILFFDFCVASIYYVYFFCIVIFASVICQRLTFYVITIDARAFIFKIKTLLISVFIEIAMTGTFLLWQSWPKLV